MKDVYRDEGAISEVMASVREFLASKEAYAWMEKNVPLQLE